MLVTKARLEFTDVFRQLVAESNGYAAILLLKQSGSSGNTEMPIVQAIEIYRSTLRLADKNSKIVEMDKIQRMHVLHNLGEALHEVDLLKQRLSQQPNTESQLQILKSVGKSLRKQPYSPQSKISKETIFRGQGATHKEHGGLG